MSIILTCCRNLLLIACLIPFSIQTKAQSKKLENLPNLVLPEFADGRVILKTGNFYRAIMNYEMLDQQMIVLKNGKYFVLGDHELIDTVIIKDRKFIPFEKYFYEVLEGGLVSLFYEHKCILESMGGVVPYDTRGSGGGLASNTTNYGPGGAIELKIPENYKVVVASETWIRKDGTMHRFSNKNQLMKLLSDKESDLKEFIKENKTDFRSIDDLIKLVHYYNELN